MQLGTYCFGSNVVSLESSFELKVSSIEAKVSIEEQVIIKIETRCIYRLFFILLPAALPMKIFLNRFDK